MKYAHLRNMATNYWCRVIPSENPLRDASKLELANAVPEY